MCLFIVIENKTETLCDTNILAIEHKEIKFQKEENTPKLAT